MASFKIEKFFGSVCGKSATLFKINFGKLTTNNVIVSEAQSLMAAIENENCAGGEIALVNGPASSPVIMVLTSHLVRRFTVVARFDPDPRIGGYIVIFSQNPDLPVGSVIPNRFKSPLFSET